MKIKSISKRVSFGGRAAGVCATILGSLFSFGLAQAANIQVNSNSASVANDGFCTLPEAVTAVNFFLPSGTLAGECPAGNGNADRIILMSSAQTYVLSNNLHIFRNVTLQGAGTSLSIIKSTAQRAIDVRVVNSLSLNVTISNLTIQNGRASGDNSIMSGLYMDDRFNPATVNLDQVNIVGCLNGIRLEGAGADGYMVNASRVSIQGSRSDGVVCRGCGARFNTSTVSGSKGRGLLVDSYLNGSARVQANLEFYGGSIEGNGSSSVNGGGVSILGGQSANMVLGGSSISGNTGADGGGVYSQGTGLVLHGVTVAKNTAARGGGIFYGAAPADTTTSEFIVRWSTIARNTASNHGGGIHTLTGRNARIDGLLIASNQDNGAAPKSPDCLGDVGNENSPNSAIGNTTGCTDPSKPGSVPEWLKTGEMQLASDLIASGAGNGIKILPFLKTSVARDAVSLGSVLDLDTRGMQRPEPTVNSIGTIGRGTLYDIGAFEWNQTWPSALLNVAAKSNDPYVADGEYFDFKPNANDDHVTFAIPVTEAGIYDVTNWVRTRSNGGNYTLEYVGSTGSYATISNKDLYSPTSVKTKWTGVVTIATPGLYYFRFRVIGVNQASSGRQLDLSSVTLQKR
jgi:hypothetical protein